MKAVWSHPFYPRLHSLVKLLSQPPWNSASLSIGMSSLAAPACKPACMQGKAVVYPLGKPGRAQDGSSSTKCKRTGKASHVHCFANPTLRMRWSSSIATSAASHVNDTHKALSSAETSKPASLAATGGVLEIREGDVHVVWTFTDKVQKSVGLWQLFRERFLPPEELAELGGLPQGGTERSAKAVAKTSMHHQEQQQVQQTASAKYHHHHHHHQHQQQQRQPRPAPLEQGHARDERGGGDATPWTHHDERVLARALTRSTLAAAINGCAVASGSVAVGFDMERLGRVPKGGKLMALARRRFAPAECAALEGLHGATAVRGSKPGSHAQKEGAAAAAATADVAPEQQHNIDFSRALRQLCPGLEDSWKKNGSGKNDGHGVEERTTRAGVLRSSGSKGSSGGSGYAPFFHITMEYGDGGHGAQHAQKGEQSAYHFLLLTLSSQYVAALCVVVPPHLSWPGPGLSNSMPSSRTPSLSAPSNTPGGSCASSSDPPENTQQQHHHLHHHHHHHHHHRQQQNSVRVYFWEDRPLWAESPGRCALGVDGVNLKHSRSQSHSDSPDSSLNDAQRLSWKGQCASEQADGGGAAEQANRGCTSEQADAKCDPEQADGECASEQTDGERAPEQADGKYTFSEQAGGRGTSEGTMLGRQGTTWSRDGSGGSNRSGRMGAGAFERDEQEGHVARSTITLVGCSFAES
ncbi:hypothetical protein DUNSADRAFT_13016 [Dunaliella salina]|uniref:Uncharacterized protein n=1 Tax=Dunaliella salina TaxID=3046 RepID=A0ABQ7GA81_DUNSA|nr:hypothetical protein DUNSADRAFT_13016 [Dunaliella salina]|eukprot:KAF5831512.1 hypothetical protein DUNSADRAFT_13016 [Dunaliella salina]